MYHFWLPISAVPVQAFPHMFLPPQVFYQHDTPGYGLCKLTYSLGRLCNVEASHERAAEWHDDWSDICQYSSQPTKDHLLRHRAAHGSPISLQAGPAADRPTREWSVLEVKLQYCKFSPCRFCQTDQTTRFGVWSGLSVLVLLMIWQHFDYFSVSVCLSIRLWRCSLWLIETREPRAAKVTPQHKINSMCPGARLHNFQPHTPILSP